MKNIKNYIVFFVLVVVFVTASISVYAADNTVTINNGFVDKVTFEITEELTWKEYIDKYNPEDFTYTSTYVYYKERRLSMVYWQDYQESGFTGPNDLITTEMAYDLNPGCDHNYTIIVNTGSYPCQDTYRVYKCSSCGYQYSKTFMATAEHQYALELSTYVEATCSSPGYERYICAACGKYDSSKITEINPTGHVFVGGSCYTPRICKVCGIEGDISLYKHNWKSATCSEDEFCLDCGKLGDSFAFGHELNWLGSCVRDGCSYNKYLNSAGETVANVFESVKDFILGDEEESEGVFSGAAKVIRIGFMIIALIILIIVIYYVIVLLIKGIKYINSRINSKKDRRRSKK